MKIQRWSASLTCLRLHFKTFQQRFGFHLSAQKVRFNSIQFNNSEHFGEMLFLFYFCTFTLFIHIMGSTLHLALRCTYSRTYRAPKDSFHNSAMLWVGGPSKNSSLLIENTSFNYPTLGVLYVPSSRSLPTLDLRPTRLGVLIVTGRASGHLPLLGT